MTPPGGAVRTWAVVGLAAQALFVLSWLVAASWQGPGYHVLSHTISDMYAESAPHGWFLVTVLTACGAGTILFAVLGLRPALRQSGWRGLVGSLLLVLSILGVGDLLSPLEREGCRLADPGCTPALQVANLGGQLDGLLSSVGLALLVTAGFFLAAAMRHVPGWHSWVAPTRIASAVLIALILATVLVPGLGGLFERLLAAAAAAGVAALALGCCAGRGERPPAAVTIATPPW